MTSRRTHASGDHAIVPDVDGGLRRSNELVLDWERAHPTSLESLLDWSDEMRAVFGDPAPDRRPRHGNDFRL